MKKKKYKNIKMEKGTSEQANERASNEQLHQINTNLFCNYKQASKRASEQAIKGGSVSIPKVKKKVFREPTPKQSGAPKLL